MKITPTLAALLPLLGCALALPVEENNDKRSVDHVDHVDAVQYKPHKPKGAEWKVGPLWDKNHDGFVDMDEQEDICIHNAGDVYNWKKMHKKGHRCVDLYRGYSDKRVGGEMETIAIVAATPAATP